MIREQLRLDVGDLEFAPNNAAAYPFEVPITPNLAGFPFFFRDAFGASFFPAKEPCTLKSIKLNLPYQFGLSTLNTYLTLQREVTGAGIQDIPELGRASSLFLPDCCDDDMDLYIAAPAEATTWRFILTAMNVHVATIGAPSSFNTHILNAQLALVVVHTLPLDVI